MQSKRPEENEKSNRFFYDLGIGETTAFKM